MRRRGEHSVGRGDEAGGGGGRAELINARSFAPEDPAEGSRRGRAVARGPGGEQEVGGPRQAGGVADDPGPCGDAPGWGLGGAVPEVGRGEVRLGTDGALLRGRAAMAGEGRAQVERRCWLALVVRGGLEAGSRGRRSQWGWCAFQGEQPPVGDGERMALWESVPQPGGAARQRASPGEQGDHGRCGARRRRGGPAGGAGRRVV